MPIKGATTLGRSDHLTGGLFWTISLPPAADIEIAGFQRRAELNTKSLVMYHGEQPQNWVFP